MQAWEEVSQAVAQPVQQLQEQLPREAVLNVDETGWRTYGDKRWIGALVAQQFVFYVVASTRGAEVLVWLELSLHNKVLDTSNDCALEFVLPPYRGGTNC
jgi:hypothetical protein